jgi:hypothetical protein
MVHGCREDQRRVSVSAASACVQLVLRCLLVKSEMRERYVNANTGFTFVHTLAAYERSSQIRRLECTGHSSESQESQGLYPPYPLAVWCCS